MRENVRFILLKKKIIRVSNNGLGRSLFKIHAAFSIHRTRLFADNRTTRFAQTVLCLSANIVLFITKALLSYFKSIFA